MEKGKGCKILDVTNRSLIEKFIPKLYLKTDLNIYTTSMNKLIMANVAPEDN